MSSDREGGMAPADGGGRSSALKTEGVRIEKAAADAGFDLTPERQGRWIVFRSTDFPACVGVAIEDAGSYGLGLSDAAIGQRLAVESGLVPSAVPSPWATRFDGVEGYPRLHGLMLRMAAIARVLHQQGLREFVATIRNPPSSTEGRWCTINKYLYNRCLASGISA